MLQEESVLVVKGDCDGGEAISGDGVGLDDGAEDALGGVEDLLVALEDLVAAANDEGTGGDTAKVGLERG